MPRKARLITTNKEQLIAEFALKEGEVYLSDPAKAAELINAAERTIRTYVIKLLKAQVLKYFDWEVNGQWFTVRDPGSMEAIVIQGPKWDKFVAEAKALELIGNVS